MGSCVPSGSWILTPFPHEATETSTLTWLPGYASEDISKARCDGFLTPRRKNPEARLREIEIYFFCCIFQTSH